MCSASHCNAGILEHKAGLSLTCAGGSARGCICSTLSPSRNSKRLPDDNIQPKAKSSSRLPTASPWLLPACGATTQRAPYPQCHSALLTNLAWAPVKNSIINSITWPTTRCTCEGKSLRDTTLHGYKATALNSTFNRACAHLLYLQRGKTCRWHVDSYLDLSADICTLILRLSWEGYVANPTFSAPVGWILC